MKIPALKVKLVSGPDVLKVSDDSGSGAKAELAIFKPKLGKDDCWIGHSGNLRENLMVVRALDPSALAAPLGYQRAWDDSGSRNKSGFSLWNIIAPRGYRALGGIARFGVGQSDHNEPSGAEVEGLVCIHESLCTEGMIGNQVWNDDGMRADNVVSVWRILARGNGGIEPSTFYCQHDWKEPGNTVYVVARTNGVKMILPEDQARQKLKSPPLKTGRNTAV